MMIQTECSDTGISMYLRLSTTPGSEETLPRRPRSPSRSSAAVLSLANRRAVLWEGRGATTRPRRARESQVFFGYIVTNLFSNIHLDMIMAFTTEEHYIIWIRSYMCRRVQTHKPVWELRTSTAPPPSLLSSVASTANLVEHNIFTSFVDRHKISRRQKAVYRLVTAPQGGTQKYTLTFAYDSPR